MLSTTSVLVILPFLAGIRAANDWNTPCVSGQCSYDLPQTNGGASGTMQIWGSDDAITDITPAAHWQILGCDPNALSQNVRMVCMTDEDDPDSLCGHVYQNTGAVNKIVRLPENCGANAFARISNAWTPTDQSIPSSVSARLVRRSGATPTVKALSIDTDWEAVDWSKTGKVNLAINAKNAPGAAAAPLVTPGPRARRRADRRGIFGTIFNGITSIAGDATSVLGGAVDDATSVLGGAVDDATSVLGEGASKVETAVSGVESKVADATTIDKSKTFDIKPITFNKSKNLFNKSIGCGPVTGSISVDMTATGNLTPELTFDVVGQLVPPKFTTFSVLAGISGSASGSVTLKADITGQIDSGKIPVVPAIGIPGLDFPGVITVGPSFGVDAEFTGELELEMDLTVGMNLQLNNAQLTFPPNNSAAPDAKAFSLGDTPLTLNASPSVKATGTLTAHLIPNLSLGVTAVGGKVDATIFIDLDTSAALVLSLDASAKVTQTVVAGNATATATAVASSNTSTAVASGDNSTAVADSGSNANSTDATGAATNSTDAAVAARADTSTSFGGCVQVNGNIAVNAGAKGDFFGLFDKDAQVSLFSKEFQIFKKCFGDGATATRRRMRRMSARLLLARDFTCPAADAAKPASITDGTVASSSITPA
ncbi:hypothetical protein C8R46DRAFT_1347894 [Mycena filopes]|nr:hypothetical protein C8R46DRAFT_1347894 [Mycena filopes]